MGAQRQSVVIADPKSQFASPSNVRVVDEGDEEGKKKRASVQQKGKREVCATNKELRNY